MKIKILLLIVSILFMSNAGFASDLKDFPRDNFFLEIYLPLGDVGKPSPNAIGKGLNGTQLNKQDCIGPGLLPAGVEEWIVIGKNKKGKVIVQASPPKPVPSPPLVVQVPLPPVPKVIPTLPPPLPPPPLPPLLPPKVIPLVVLPPIYFDINKSMIDARTAGTLDKIGKILKENPKMKIEIMGHTDDSGVEVGNKKLSEKRALSAQKYLSDKFGISEDRLIAKGYGSTKPIADNKTIEGRRQNRRVEFHIIEK